MRKVRHSFSLVEVIIALIIIVIAIVAIAGIFPISMRMHNHAMTQNKAADIAEELVSLAAYKLRTVGTPFSDSETDVKTIIQTADLDINSAKWIDSGGDDAGGDDTAYYYYDNPPQSDGNLMDGVVRVIQTHDAYRGGQKVTVTELDVVLAIWESTQPETLYFNDYSDATNSLNFARGSLENANDHNSDDVDTRRLMIEASWPGSVEYAEREKFTMVLEVNTQP